ncbi:ParB/RepB/Spo0J family partition protein [Planomonospora corallina]|uniref:ParB/RepB/Spo0J family partition protein n=1 Tax=Planomonospora corallina TaxID=1806052 RepID=A0ABV8I7L7_9ACTN
MATAKPATKAARTTADDETPKKIMKMVPVSKIDRDPGQPREHFDEAKLNELAASMKALGQLQSVTVRYNPETKRHTLVMGERRWRAAQIAGITELRAEVLYGVPDGDPQTLARAVAENVARADMTPMEEAKGFQKLVDLGYPIEEVAVMCGKSEAYVGWRIDLLKLAVPVQEALIKGHLPVGLAWYVANLSADNQQRFLGRWTRGEFATTRDAEAFAQACRQAEEERAAQGSFFVLAEGVEEAARAVGARGQDRLFGEVDLPSEERERIAAARKQLTGKIERLGTAGAILSELATTDPGELALLLAGAPGGIAAQKLRIEHLREVSMKAAKTLREAQAVAAVRAGALQVDPELAAAPADASSHTHSAA